MRVARGDIGWAKRVLDSGDEGIILPRAQTVEEIRQSARSCRHPPLDTRGFGPRRPTNYGRFGGQEYLDHANENLFVAAQIETIDLVHQIDEIVQIKELTSICIGPNDLSGTMGMLGNTTHPDVLDAIRTIATKARENGLYVGSGMSGDPVFANTLKDLGVQWMQVGGDFEYMMKYAQQLYDQIRN